MRGFNVILGAAKTLSIALLAMSLAVSCGPEPVDPTPPTPVTPVDPTPAKDTKAPVITVSTSTVNVIASPAVTVSGNELKIGDQSVASWKDDVSSSCAVALTFTPAEGSAKALNSGDKLSEAGKLQIKATDEADNSSTAEVDLTAVAVFGLENLQNKQLQVDQEVNILEGLTIAEGLTLQKVEIEMGGVRTEVSDPEAFTPDYPDTVNIILTIAKPDNSTLEVRADNLTVKALPYQAVSITNLDPAEIMPIINQVEQGDKDCYKHIEHLRLAETVRILDMMWEYGTAKHTKEQYQELMMRLNPVMLEENPIGFDNYETVGGELLDKPSKHAHNEFDRLNRWIKHANFKVINTGRRGRDWYNLCKNNPSKINIGGLSRGVDAGRDLYDARDNEEYKKYDKAKNGLIFYAGGNIKRNAGIDDGIYKHKIYQEDYTLDEDAVYMEGSRAHNKDDVVLDRHLEISVGTNRKGDVDITDQIASNYSKQPRGFHPKVLFSGRELPYVNVDGIVCAGQRGMYESSYANYVNVVIACLCFQMFAEVEDVDQLLEMIRSTALTDYIRYKGDTQDLQLMNPAGVFNKYCMITDAPSSISTGNIIDLNLGWYKGLVFDIPGAEALVDGQWIAYDAKNKDAILAQNPMTLSWRLNGDLLKKMGYTSGETVEGQVITVDDQWNGLSLTKPISVQIQ